MQQLDPEALHDSATIDRATTTLRHSYVQSGLFEWVNCFLRSAASDVTHAALASYAVHARLTPS